MLHFRNFFRGRGLKRGQPPPQMIVIKLNIKEMHFRPITGHTHYTRKFWTCLNCWITVPLFVVFTQPQLPIPIPVSVSEELLLEPDDNNTAAVTPTHNYDISEMLNEAKILRLRPRSRPELWGRGRGLSFKVEAKARAMRSRPISRGRGQGQGKR